MSKKHPQFILGMDDAYFRNTSHCADVNQTAFSRVFNDGITCYLADIWLNEVQSYLAIRERHWLDEITHRSTELNQHKGDRRYRQLLPYLIARQKQASGDYLYFPYRRTKQVGESRLAGKGAIGYGGHIDLSDVVSVNSVIDLKSTVILSVLREAEEELLVVDGLGDVLDLSDFNLIQFSDLFITQNTDPEILHVGIVLLLDIPFGYMIKIKETELISLTPMTAHQLLHDPSFNPESWTKLYLEYVEGSTVTTLNHGDETVAVVEDGNWCTAEEIDAAHHIRMGSDPEYVAKFSNCVKIPKCWTATIPVTAAPTPFSNLYPDGKVTYLRDMSIEHLTGLPLELASAINPYEFDFMSIEQLGAIKPEFLTKMEFNAKQAYIKRCSEVGAVPI